MRRYDVLVVGSGIAGLFTALQASKSGSVALVTKAALEESNTRYAQGGIAAVTADDDKVDLHIADTLAAGVGLCDRAAVEVLCTEGPSRIADLLAIGVAFDRNGEELARGMEAAHSRHRVLHAGGDATGAVIEASLAAAVRQNDRIDVYESMFLTDLTMSNGSATGGTFLDSEGVRQDIAAAATVLASGGAGQMFRYTTNPSVATGDGVAAAFRAGATIGDAEMFQFHPTAMQLGGTFLISEAVRGEGAVLRNHRGERFVDELAPRDVVARAIAAEMALNDGEPVFLDATALGAETLTRRFPSIDAMCKARGVDWAREPVPVTPAAHYWMGGIRTDTYGRTSIHNLFACGEVANTGVHGANRLASNSLLEGIVFGKRLATLLSGGEHGGEISAESNLVDDAMQVTLPTFAAVGQQAGSHQMKVHREDVARAMWDGAGLVRDAHGLKTAGKQLNVLARQLDISDNTDHDKRELHQLRNLITVGSLLVDSAILRKESRGGHFRSDFPQTDPSWQRRITLKAAI